MSKNKPERRLANIIMNGEADILTTMGRRTEEQLTDLISGFVAGMVANFVEENPILATHYALTKDKFGEHWLYVAAERLSAGETEAEVMLDYGYHYEK